MQVLIHPQFQKDAKRLQKKYPSLRDDIVGLIDSLPEHPTQGTYLGNDLYKIRLRISSKNAGKRGGARVISFVQIIQDQVVLLTIYDKSEIENVSDEFLNELVKDFFGQD